jgi:hypothetical protein
MAAGSSAFDGKREPEPRRSGVAETLFAPEGHSAISALNDKSEPGPRQLPLVKGTLALNGKSESRSRPFSVVGGTSELYDKSEPEPRQPPVVGIISALNDKSESGPRQLLEGGGKHLGALLYDKSKPGAR